MADKVIVAKLSQCNFCSKDAHYDAKTSFGPWASMCEEHYKKYGIGLGTGKGQELVLEDKDGN